MQLGQGNDVIDVDTAGNLDATLVRVMGGFGNDTLTATSLGSRTVWSGGADQDTAVVPITGLPTSGQFNNLRLDTEQLVVDNSTNSTSVAWTLTDLSLIADELVAGVPAGNPVTVLSTDGVGRTRIVGGTGTDTLDVVTTTITETFGEIDLDSSDADSYDNVQLDFGGEVFVPDQSSTLQRADVNLDFDSLAGIGKKFEFAGAKIASDGVLIADDWSGSAAITAGSVSDLLTLQMISGGKFGITSLEVATTSGSATRTIQFTGTLADGSTQVVNRSVSENAGFQSISALGFNGPLSKLSWSMQSDEWIRSISFTEYPEIGFADPVVDSQTYIEEGIEFSTDGQFVLGLNQSLVNDTLRVNEFFSTITDIRVASTNGLDEFQLKSVRIKDTLREGAVSVDVFGQSGYISSLSFTGAIGYQTIPISTGDSTYFDIRTRTNQVIDEIVVNDGTNDITITLDGLVDGNTTYSESTFTITNEGAPMQLVDGGVSDTVTNTVTVTSLAGAPFDVSSVALRVDGTDNLFARNDFVDFIGHFAAGGSIVQRVSATEADGVVSADLVGFEELSSMTFRLQGEGSPGQVIHGLYLGNDQTSTILFDDYLTASRRHVEDGLELVTDGTLVAFGLGGQVLGTGRAADTLTLRPLTGVSVTTANDGQDTSANYSLVQVGNGSAPSILTVDGWDNNFVRLAHDGESGQAAAYVSSQVLPAWTGVAEYAFDFRSNSPGSGDGADGWGWALLNTAQWGASGSTGGGFGPEPNFAGSLGVGFDTLDNGARRGQFSFPSLRWRCVDIRPVDFGTVRQQPLGEWPRFASRDQAASGDHQFTGWFASDRSRTRLEYRRNHGADRGLLRAGSTPLRGASSDRRLNQRFRVESRHRQCAISIRSGLQPDHPARRCNVASCVIG